VTYLSLARNIGNGNGYIDFTGLPNTTFPPLFPALLVAGHLAGISMQQAVRVLNAAAFAAVAVVSWLLLRRVVARAWISGAALILIGMSPAVLNTAYHVWSDALFCALALLCLLLLGRAVDLGAEPGASARDRLVGLGIAGLVAGAAMMTKYVGVSLVLTGMLVVLVQRRDEDARELLRRILVFATSAMALPALWVARNATSGARYLLGPRVADPQSVVTLGQSLVSSLGSVIGPQWSTLVWTLALGVVGASAALGLAFRRRSAARSGGATIVALATFVVFHGSIVLVSGKLSGSSVDDRLVATLAPPILITAAWLVDNMLGGAFQHGGMWLKVACTGLVATVCAVIVAASAPAFVATATRDGRSQRGYNTKRSRSPLATVVGDLSSRSLVTTNHPWTLYLGSSHEPILPTPGPMHPAVSIPPATVHGLETDTCRQPVYLAWYGSDASTALLPTPPAELDPRAVRVVPDGVLYALRSDEPCVDGSPREASARSAPAAPGRGHA
jgi:4-amino-4-deoxy-L-arabinose transferase-like glycosyltransferase